ncbi:MAG: cobalamin-dependent protein, partial [Deltaproteobacteria bacterium]|nr:cobalamin-dependent protein [Deltaproteobacteria bacterium]
MTEARFPIGLGYLSAMLKQKGHSTELVDRFCDHDAWVEDISQFDFVGVYTSTPCYEDALHILELLEDYEGPIAFGGPHTSTFPLTIPPRVDYVVQGEAEYLINDLVEGKFPKDTIIRTQRIANLDALPQADYDLFLDRPRSYLWTTPFSSDREPIFLFNSSRSCHYQCMFCTVRDIWGRLYSAH